MGTAGSLLLCPTSASAKIVIPRRAPSATYEERKQRMAEARRMREEKEQEEADTLGPIVTLPSGVQFRQITNGDASKPEARPNTICDISYTVYRLSSGAYFKYSSGGTPIYLFSLGYGNEGKDDVGSTFTFTMGDRSAVPLAVANAVVGMHPKAVRRILIPPSLGWNTDRELGLVPDTFGGKRRLENHKMEALLMDVEVVKVRELDNRPKASPADIDMTLNPPPQIPYKLPAPPKPLS